MRPLCVLNFKNLWFCYDILFCFCFSAITMNLDYILISMHKNVSHFHWVVAGCRESTVVQLPMPGLPFSAFSFFYFSARTTGGQCSLPILAATADSDRVTALDPSLLVRCLMKVPIETNIMSLEKHVIYVLVRWRQYYPTPLPGPPDQIFLMFFPCGKYTDPVMQFVILFFLLVCYITQPTPMESPFPFRIVFIVVGYSCIFSTGWILLWLC